MMQTANPIVSPLYGRYSLERRYFPFAVLSLPTTPARRASPCSFILYADSPAARM